MKGGFDVEIYPNFSPDSWGGGFLPFRVAAAPAEFVGLHLCAPAVSGFEIEFTPESAHQTVEEAQLFIEAVHSCYNRLGAEVVA